MVVESGRVSVRPLMNCCCYSHYLVLLLLLLLLLLQAFVDPTEGEEAQKQLETPEGATKVSKVLVRDDDFPISPI